MWIMKIERKIAERTESSSKTQTNGGNRYAVGNKYIYIYIYDQ